MFLGQVIIGWGVGVLICEIPNIMKSVISIVGYKKLTITLDNYEDEFNKVEK